MLMDKDMKESFDRSYLSFNTQVCFYLHDFNSNISKILLRKEKNWNMLNGGNQNL